MVDWRNHDNNSRGNRGPRSKQRKFETKGYSKPVRTTPMGTMKLCCKVRKSKEHNRVLFLQQRTLFQSMQWNYRPMWDKSHNESCKKMLQLPLHQSRGWRVPSNTQMSFLPRTHNKALCTCAKKWQCTWDKGQYIDHEIQRNTAKGKQSTYRRKYTH